MLLCSVKAWLRQAAYHARVAANGAQAPPGAGKRPGPPSSQLAWHLPPTDRSELLMRGYKTVALCGLLSALMCSTACVVAGYSSRGGWFVWPGSLLLVLVLLIVLWLLRRG